MKFKRTMSLLLAFVMLFSAAALLASCDDEDSTSSTSATTSSSEGTQSTPSTNQGTTPSTNQGTIPSTGSSEGSGDSGNDEQGALSSYVIKITDKNTGKGLANVNVFMYAEANENGIMYARGKTDANGFVTLKAEAKYAKYVFLDDVPNGYENSGFYELGPTGAEISLGTSIIENDGDFANIELALGDVMYDFTLSTFAYNKETGEYEAKTVKLSDLFASGKKAVMLNFWYTTCTYCIEEFPYIQAAYEKYGDQIEIIAIDAFGDTESEIKNFVNDFAKGGVYTTESCPLTFPMAIDTLGLQSAFGFEVNPCTVIIDRYGVVSMVQVGGVMGERYFTNAIEHYVSEDYEQELYSSIYDLSPLMKPDIEMSPSEDIKEATVVGDVNITFRPETEGKDAEYSWPFVVVDKDGKSCIASTNMDLDNSWAIIYADVELKAGQGIMFDYYASTQRMYDVLYVLVDGKDIYTISGRPLEDENGDLLEDPWKTCCPWVAESDGVYELAFCYIKDTSDKEGEDRVYLDNFKVVDKEDINVETYIPRDVATDLNLDNTYANYKEVVYNEEDGYYHIGTADGPLLLAGLLGVNTPFTSKLPEEERYTVTIKLTEDGEFIMDGKDEYTSFITYCNYASNSKLYGYCPVTKQLKAYLEEFVEQNDFYTTENTWLELCAYYDAYGTDTEFADPIKGLAPFSAYETKVTEEGEEGFQNSVTYTQIVMPRGFLYSFIPTESGVYRITSNSSQEVDGWVFTGSFDQWMNENGGDRILYLDSTTGERYCPELNVDLGNGKFERDFKNCSMIGYFEAGVEYFIDIAYYDVYGAGTFTFDVKYVGKSFNVFEEASQGVFTFIEGVGGTTGDIIAGGIDVRLCEDENDPRYGYYCHLLPNGSLGSIVYADFHYTTNIFSSQSITTLIEQGAFNMFMTETDREAYYFVKNYYDKDGISALEELWGEDFEENWELYQMDDAIEGIYHGKGPDYTEDMRAYLDKIEDGTDGTSGNFVYPERQGCVPVDAKLATMLQALMDKYTFANVDHSWTKLCYYYKTLEAPTSSEDKYEELNSMVNGAEIKSDEIKAEIDDILAELNAALENTTVEIVKRNLIDSAMQEIYVLIEADQLQ